MMKLEHDRLRQFITAGNARFTVQNVQTGNRYTYRVRKSDDGRVHFVAVLTGTDNTNHYTYIGLLVQGKFLANSKRVGQDAPSSKVFSWCWQRLERLPSQVEVCHEGRCGRCGRVLTVPESIKTGFGPECAGRV